MQYKYDKRENRIFKICSIVFAVLLSAALIIMIFSDKASDIGIMGIVATLILLGCPLPLFISVCAFADSSIYIKKLEKGGIVVPENKKEEPALLQMPVYDEEEQDSGESLTLAIICGCVVIGLGIYLILYMDKWLSRGVYDCRALAFIHLVIMVFWCAGGVFFFIQRSKKHYRDATVFDPGRKERVGIVKGVVTILLCLAITVVAVSVMENMTDYVYKSRLETIYGEHWRIHVGEPLVP